MNVIFSDDSNSAPEANSYTDSSIPDSTEKTFNILQNESQEEPTQLIKKEHNCNIVPIEGVQDDISTVSIGLSLEGEHNVNKDSSVAENSNNFMDDLTSTVSVKDEINVIHSEISEISCIDQHKEDITLSSYHLTTVQDDIKSEGVLSNEKIKEYNATVLPDTSQTEISDKPDKYQTSLNPIEASLLSTQETIRITEELHQNLDRTRHFDDTLKEKLKQESEKLTRKTDFNMSLDKSVVIQDKEAQEELLVQSPKDKRLENLGKVSLFQSVREQVSFLFGKTPTNPLKSFLTITFCL